ncbi:low affinity immunoglobulin gamma Fc region receptor II [Labeo rohita]|uniref:low affinity immunoglobulin gamma Fc region receptor II n=1 Tax=Labeo rohita TaxID=84645 RepID=UPI0021E1E4FD|nr:low affinity immunoglobulin gamma Fc region receptor II [Labeo rohita]
MELSLLPIMLLLISSIHHGHTQDKIKVTVKPQNSVFTGDTVTLSCDMEGAARQRTVWFKDSTRLKVGDETEILRNVNISNGGKYACTVSTTTQSQKVVLTVRERPKPVVNVHPDGRVLKGQTVTLTCDIQETNVTSWNYSWTKDDSVIHVSQSQEYTISSVHESHTGNYSCTGNETQGSRYSHTSDKVTLSVSGEYLYIYSSALFHALLIGVIAGLSVAFLLTFLLVLLFCCKRNKGGGSLSPSTDHQLQNISQTSQHPRKSGQTPLHSDIVIGHSDVTYVKIDLKSMKEMKKKKRENKGNESSNTVYSNLRM